MTILLMNFLFTWIILVSVQLLSDEYALMSPNTLEANELIMSSQYQRINVLTHPASPEAAKKIAGTVSCSIFYSLSLM